MQSSDAFYISENDPPSKRGILKAALKLFAQSGVDGTNIRAIAAESGYTNPALFKHFESKEALALYLFEKCYLQNLFVLTSAVSAKNTYPEKLRALVQAFAEFINTQPEAFFFVQENLREYWPKLSQTTRQHSLFGQFRHLLQQGRSEGVINSAIAIDIQLAALTGFLSHLARMNYFNELKTGIVARTDEIEEMIIKMFQP